MKYALLVLIVLFFGCKQEAKKDGDSGEKRHYQEEENLVDTIILHSQVFRKQLVSNGKLTALRKCDLHFATSERLVKLYTQNGKQIKRAAKIGELRDFKAKQRLKRANISIKKARLDLQDKLIGQGYNIEHPNVPDMIMEVARVRSGIDSAEEELRAAEKDVESCVLVAPFSGKIANLSHKRFEDVSSGEVFCTLIDDSFFEVEFSVLETELKDVVVGHDVRVVPFANNKKEIVGRVVEINPVVDENGLVTIKAEIKNDGKLLEGMNVKVLIENEIPNCLVVPKSAVVLRQNLEVMFRCKRDTVARWTYVHTIAENSKEYTIIANSDRGASVAEGDTVIISGNLNLADDAKVKIK